MGHSRIIWLAVLACSLGVPLVARADDDDQPRGELSPVATEITEAERSTQIDQLVEELGSDRYIERRRAQQELRRLGLAAFDHLHKAVTNVDPEIAAAAEYLLRQVPVPWTTSDDSPEVRKLLDGYGDLSEEHRLTRIAQLMQLPPQESLAPLCRIVRFDLSELVSRMAAVAVLRPRARTTESRQLVDQQVIERTLVGSTRHAAEWLRLFARQLRDPAETLDEWERYVDTEAQLAEGRPAANFTGDLDATSSIVVVNLMWHLLDLYQQLGETDQAVATMARILDQDPDEFETTSIELIDWFAEIEATEALDELLQQYDEQLSVTRRPQYAAAVALKQQGRIEEAEKLAARAVAVPVPEARHRINDAQVFLLERGQWDWAELEFQRAIENEPLESEWSLLARVLLSMLEYDLEDYANAAQVLQPVEEKIESDVQFRKAYNLARKRLASFRVSLPAPKQLSARRTFYLAGSAAGEQDWETQRKYLRDSIERDPEDADVLIAMYRAPGTDEAWQEDVRQRIVDLAGKFQREIDEDPTNPTAYNQWAWLVSNTEGDYQKAIRYSQRSLDLVPEGGNQAVYLDTLGRCYFAVGDYETATKVQRTAVENDGSLKVMQRQLAQFEQALAEAKSKE